MRTPAPRRRACEARAAGAARPGRQRGLDRVREVREVLLPVRVDPLQRGRSWSSRTCTAGSSRPPGRRAAPRCTRSRCALGGMRAPSDRAAAVRVCARPKLALRDAPTPATPERQLSAGGRQRAPIRAPRARGSVQTPTPPEPLDRRPVRALDLVGLAGHGVSTTPATSSSAWRAASSVSSVWLIVPSPGRAAITSGRPPARARARGRRSRQRAARAARRRPRPPPARAIARCAARIPRDSAARSIGTPASSAARCGETGGP